MSKKDELLKQIEKKQTQRDRAARESETLNNGKYRNSLNAKMSKILVTSFDKELQNLYQKLENITE